MPARDDLMEMPDSRRGGRRFDQEVALFALGALTGPYLPWGSGSMKPAGLVAVCNDVVLNERRSIVELGSGVSTVMLARLLHRSAGAGRRRLVAVEHDATWRRWVAGQLHEEGVDHDVVVLAAPLRPMRAADAAPGWYDEAVLDQTIGAIDLLVVDGPPAFGAGLGLARHPALPKFRDRLAPGATVVLDDVERPGEQEVLRRWEDEFGLAFRRDEHAGVAIATVP
jgi:Methyltransferase domain